MGRNQFHRCQLETRSGDRTPLHVPSEPGPAGRTCAGPFSGCALLWTLQRGSAFVVPIGVFVVTSRGEEYRRRARACFDAAHSTQNEPMCAALLRLAEDWLRMAEGWDDPPTVQQQQVQPKAGDKR